MPCGVLLLDNYTQGKMEKVGANLEALLPFCFAN